MIKLIKHYRYTCDDCECFRTFDNDIEARKNGWAISRGRKKCYCEVCSLYHRYVGTAGAVERSEYEIARRKYGF